MCLPDTAATPVGDSGTPTTPDEAPVFTSIDVTHLAVRYDLNQPIYAGNTIPVSIGITARSAGPAVPQQVYFSLDLLDEAQPGATPEQLRNVERCGLGVFDVTITPDGREQIFSREFHVPPQCAVPAAGQRGRAYNLAVVIDSVYRYQLPDFRAFTERERAVPTSPSNRCRNDVDPMSTTRGCVYRLLVEPAPGVNIAMQGLEPDSRVAVLWARPDVTAGSGVHDPSSVAVARPDRRPLEPGEDALATVNMRLESFGLDPYAHSDADNALPGPVAISYRIAPASLLISEGQPLTMRARDRGLAQTTLSEEFSELGTAETNHRVHDLYPTDAVYNLLNYGAWRRETQFRIQGCAVPSFREGGNLGVVVDGARADLAQDNCREFTVRLVRAATTATEAATAALDFSFPRTWGSSSTVGLSVALNSNNSVTASTRGAVSNNSVAIDLIGLASFPIFSGYYNLVVTPQTNGSGRARAHSIFGIVMASESVYAMTGPPWQSTSTSRDDTFSRESCRSFRFPVGFGINVEVSECVSGTMGVASASSVTATAYPDRRARPQSTEFPGASAVLAMSATVRPHLEIGLTASAGVSLGVRYSVPGLGSVQVDGFRGTVRGVFDLLSFSMPIVPSLRFGYFPALALPPTRSRQNEFRIAGAVTVDGAIEYLGGRIYLDGDVGHYDVEIGYYPISTRERGTLWSGTMNLFNFTAQRESRNYYSSAFAAQTLF